MFVALTVVASTASLNVAVTTVVGETPTALFAGLTTTDGPSSRVVHDDVNAEAKVLPARSATAVVTVTAVSCVRFGSGEEGTNSATRVVALYVTAPGPFDALMRMLKFAVVMVVGAIGSLNVTVACACSRNARRTVRR